MPTLKESVPFHKTLYVSGPMSGRDDHNFPAFRDAATKLRNMGWSVVSPAELDGEGSTAIDEVPVGSEAWSEYLARDLKIVADCGAVVVLPEWEQSLGAKLEVYVAHALGKPIFRLDTLQEIEPWEVRPPRANGTILEEAEKLVGGDRGEQYGHPYDDFSRSAKIATAILQPLLRDGAEIRPEHIPLIMMGVKLSRHTHYPQRDNLVDIAGYARTGEMVAEKVGWRR